MDSPHSQWAHSVQAGARLDPRSAARTQAVAVLKAVAAARAVRSAGCAASSPARGPSAGRRTFQDVTDARRDRLVTTAHARRCRALFTDVDWPAGAERVARAPPGTGRSLLVPSTGAETAGSRSIPPKLEINHETYRCHLFACLFCMYLMTMEVTSSQFCIV